MNPTAAPPASSTAAPISRPVLKLVLDCDWPSNQNPAGLFASRTEDSCSLAAFRRKQLSLMLPACNRLPSIVKDTHQVFFFFVQSRTLLFRARPASTPTAAAVPLPSPSSFFPHRTLEELIPTSTSSSLLAALVAIVFPFSTYRLNIVLNSALALH